MPPKWFVPRSDQGEFWTGERCFIRELLNDAASPETSLAIARVEPGVTTQLHRLDGVRECYIVAKGEGLVEIDGATQELMAGDSVVIEPGVAQRITNTGGGDLEFYCLCTPRFRPEAYINLEG